MKIESVTWKDYYCRTKSLEQLIPMDKIPKQLHNYGINATIGTFKSFSYYMQYMDDEYVARYVLLTAVYDVRIFAVKVWTGHNTQTWLNS